MTANDVDHPDRNEVTLTGRLAGGCEDRELPSGDVLWTFRLVVRRPRGERGTLDTIDCVSTRRQVARALMRIEAGERVTVAGSLRRRFWRGPAGAQSRYAVDVRTLTRVKD